MGGDQAGPVCRAGQAPPRAAGGLGMTTRENRGMPSEEEAFILPLVTWTEKGLPPPLDAQTSHSSWESFGHK